MHRNLFTAFVVLVFAVIHSAEPVPISSFEHARRQEIVSSLDQTLPPSLRQANGHIPGIVFPKAGEGEQEKAPSPDDSQSRKTLAKTSQVLVTPAAAGMQDPTATWSSPMIPSGDFRPMPEIILQSTEGSDKEYGKPDENCDDVDDHAGAEGSHTKPLYGESTAEANNKTVSDEHPPAELVGSKAAVPATKAEEAHKPEASLTFANTSYASLDSSKLKDLIDELEEAQRDNKHDSLTTSSVPSPTAEQPAKAVEPATSKARRAWLQKRVVRQSKPTGREERLKDASERRTGSQGSAGGLYRRKLSIAEAEGQDVDAGDKERCETLADEKTFVPITYAELRLIKQGLYQLQRVDGKAKECLGVVDDRPTLVPVSDEQMDALQHGTLQMMSTKDPNVVILETAKEANVQQDLAEKGKAPASEAEDGPMYDVVPIEESPAQFSLADAEELREKERLRSMLEALGGHKQPGSTSSERARRSLNVATVASTRFRISKRQLADRFVKLEPRVEGE